MPQEAMEITPTGYVDEATGETIINDFAVNGQLTEEIRQNEEFEQSRRFIIDEETGETEYSADASEVDYDNILHMYGDETYINEVADWAEQHYSEEEIQWYSEVMARGDLNEIAYCVDFVNKAYEDRNPDAEEFQRQIEPDNIAVTETEEYVYRNIIDYDGYTDMVEWAENNLDQDTIKHYNAIMESNNKQLITESVKSLKNFYTRNR
tara:strand:- start:2072 stop:2695 length:624 start_codon:yes stop_codon:yes gene_type:complete